MAGHVFISYSRRDTAYVHALVRYLQSQGLSVWFDDSLHAGTGQWVKAIEQAIEDAVVVVAVMSADSDGSVWVDRELDLAQELRKPIVPLLLSGRCFLRLRDRQFEDVTAGQMPGATFVAQLRAPAPAPAYPVTATPPAYQPPPVTQPGLTPSAVVPPPAAASYPSAPAWNPYAPPAPAPAGAQYVLAKDRTKTLAGLSMLWSVVTITCFVTFIAGWVYAVKALRESRQFGSSPTIAYVAFAVAALMTVAEGVFITYEVMSGAFATTT